MVLYCSILLFRVKALYLTLIVRYRNFTLQRTRLQNNLMEMEEGPILLQQEEAICAMVSTNNAIKLRDVQSAVIEDHNMFGNIDSISIATVKSAQEKWNAI